jgi:hypothetical protein
MASHLLALYVNSVAALVVLIYAKGCKKRPELSVVKKHVVPMYLHAMAHACRPPDSNTCLHRPRTRARAEESSARRCAVFWKFHSEFQKIDGINGFAEKSGSARVLFLVVAFGFFYFVLRLQGHELLLHLRLEVYPLVALLAVVAALRK